MDSDFLLIQKMKNGDGEAVERFVRKYYPKIFQYCLLHIRNRNDAEDLTQETFLKFFQSFAKYRHQGKCSSYLYTVAANTCKDYYKKKKESQIGDIEEGVAENPGMETEEVRMDVENALARLPVELRETAVLFFFQGLKQRDIARVLNIKVSLVKYRVSRAKILLAEYLKEES